MFVFQLHCHLNLVVNRVVFSCLLYTNIVIFTSPPVAVSFSVLTPST